MFFRWYRASILKVAEIEESSDSSSDSGGVAPYHMTQVEYLCLFVDYGDREWVWSKGVEPICPELLEVSTTVDQMKSTNNIENGSL